MHAQATAKVVTTFDKACGNQAASSCNCRAVKLMGHIQECDKVMYLLYDCSVEAVCVLLGLIGCRALGCVRQKSHGGCEKAQQV